MIKDTLLKQSFILSLVCILVGAFLKIVLNPWANAFLIVGLIEFVICWILALYEIRTSKRIDHTEKTRWLMAFIFFSGIAAPIYMLFNRKRIAGI